MVNIAGSNQGGVANAKGVSVEGTKLYILLNLHNQARGIEERISVGVYRVSIPCMGIIAEAIAAT